MTVSGVKCFDCGEDVHHETGAHIVIELRSHRMNTLIHRPFCGAKCRDRWYDAGVDADLLHISSEGEVYASCEALEAARAALLTDEEKERAAEVGHEIDTSELRRRAKDRVDAGDESGAEHILGIDRHDRMVSGFIPTDREIVYQVHHVDKRGAEAPLVSGRAGESMLHETPESVNLYWREPAEVTG